jgi:transcriptional regulator GlxA family with amidase domain
MTALGLRMRVVLIAYPGFQVLDLAAPAEVLGAANDMRPGAYEIEILGYGAAPVTGASGLRVMPSGSLSAEPPCADTLILPGGPGVDDMVEDPTLVGWVRVAGSSVRRMASVCSGAFLLAAAGLLDGRRVATHWARAGELQQRCPAAVVETEPLVLRDGPIYSSAGVTAGANLALGLVEEDFGASCARAVGRRLMIPLCRLGGQRQFIHPAARTGRLAS